VLLVRLYPDSYQQDGGYHYLFARWALEHPRNLVDVWGRPLFTALYALPARLGYSAAKLLTVAVCLGTAWHTARLAREHGLSRAELAVPLLFLQPSFLLLSSETMTEPLFALGLAIALRLHRAGRVGAGMRVVGLLPLARPEGFFVGVLWGVVVLFDRRAGASLWRRALSALQLAWGAAAWWVASWALTGDRLFILHNWPRNWNMQVVGADRGSLWQYGLIAGEVLAGPVLQGLFVLGLAALVLARRALLPIACLVLVAVLHSLFFRFGLFGSVGYARYLVSVSPPLALATLSGWNLLAGWARRVPAVLARAAGGLTLVAALVWCLAYVDGFGSSRDARAVDDMVAWFRAHPLPVRRFVWSQAYMSIRLGRDPLERPFFGGDRERNAELLRTSPPGTLVLWDAHTGPLFRKLTAEDIQRAGYRLVHHAGYTLPPRLPLRLGPDVGYQQELWLFYKE
jgi:hypothetical protein